jgi:hypothetical protein
MAQHQSHGNSVLVSQPLYKSQDEWSLLSSGFLGAAEDKDFVPSLDPSSSDDSDSLAHQPRVGQVMLSSSQQQVVKKRRKQPDNFGTPQISFHFEKADCELRKSKSEPSPNNSSGDEADVNENASYGYEDPDAAAAANRLRNLTLGRSTGSRQIPVTKVHSSATPPTNAEEQPVPARGWVQETEETGYLSKTSSTDSTSPPSQPRRQHSHRTPANKQCDVGDADKSPPLQDRSSSNRFPSGYEDTDAQPAVQPARNTKSPRGYGGTDAKPVPDSNPYGYGDPDAKPVPDSNPYGYGDTDAQPVPDSNPYGYGDTETQTARDVNPYGYGDTEPQPARPSRGRRQYSRRGSVTKFSIQASIEVVQKSNTSEQTTYKSRNGSGEPFFPFSSQRGSKTNNTMEAPSCNSVEALQGIMKNSSPRSISDSRRSGSIGALRINPSLPNAGSEELNPSWRASPHFSSAARSNSLRSVLNKALSETGSIEGDPSGQSTPAHSLQDSASSLPSYPIAKTQPLRCRQGRRPTERDRVDDANLHVLLDESLDASLSNVLP